MCFPKLLLACAVAGILAPPAPADFVVVDPAGGRPQGPVSPYFLDAGRNVYVVQGNAVIYSFPLVYGPSEGVIAVSSTVNTRPEFTPGPGQGGQYTLAGTPTGVTETYPLPPGLIFEVSYDGTSNGNQNFYVQHFGNTGGSTTDYVLVTDLQWQNPEVVFGQEEPGNRAFGIYEGIAYDGNRNSVWISSAQAIYEYALTPDGGGQLVRSFPAPLYIPPLSFPMGPFANSALGYDPLDDTLWISYNSSNLLEQYSTTGVLLQYGTPTGLPDIRYESGDFANVPEPTSFVLLLAATVALFWLRRHFHA